MITKIKQSISLMNQYIYLKRILDFMIALLLSPVVIAVTMFFGILIKLEDNGPVFYNAFRLGKSGKRFVMFKLRSMKINAPDIRNSDGSTFSSIHDERVTRIGKFLRKTSIDELPQVFNVLNGTMSFIGPRPMLYTENLQSFDDLFIKRLKVRPGITGFTQAYFRNSISQQEKINYDAYYAENLSFKLDLKILFETMNTVLKQKNVFSN